MSKHTPGPWKVETCGEPDCWCRIIVSEKPDDEGCYTVISSGSMFENNAALIAAAPDLLAALQALYDCAEEESVKGGTDDELRRAELEAIDPIVKQQAAAFLQARAAIRKATGEA